MMTNRINLPQKTEKVKKANSHLLYKKEQKKVRNVYRVFIEKFHNQTPEFYSILNTLYDAKPDDVLEFRIMSPGGLVTECQQLVNVAENKFKGKVSAYIESHAASAGAILFTSADKRVIYWNSKIMFHNYSGGYSGEFQKMKDRIEFDEKEVIGFLSIAKPFFTKKEWKKLVKGKEYWFNAKQMLKRNIATHIVIDGVEYSKEEGLQKLKEYKQRLKSKPSEQKNNQKEES